MNYVHLRSFFVEKLEGNIMENKNKSIGCLGAIKWMYSFIKVYKSWFLLGAAAAITLMIANVFKAYYTQEIVNKALDGQFNELINIVVIFVFIIISTVLSEYLSKYAVGKCALYATRDMKEKLSMHLTRVSIGSTKWTQAGDLASRVNNDTEHVTNFMKNDFLNVVIQPLMGLVAVVYILFINWKLLLISISLIPLLMFAANWLTKNIGKLVPESYKYLGEASGVVEEAIKGIDILKTYNLEEKTNKKVKEIFRNNFKTEFEMYKYVAPMQAVGLSLAWGPRLICALYGGHMALNGEIQVGTLVAVLQLLEYIAFPTAGFAWILGNIRRAVTAIDRIDEVFNIPKEDANGEPFKKYKKDLAVKFNNVSFGYNDSKSIIKNLSFELHESKMVAFVGESGSGKSTIMDLICGLYKCSEGEIELFGVDLNKLNVQSIREHIAVVSQDTYVFPGTIKENIMLGRKEAEIDDVISAAKAACAHEFITDMPEGYNTVIGEGGITLSGGQRQRISIARAFIKNTPILLLDEPTASLDNYSEALVQKSLEKLIEGRTVLVIAHKLSTVINADNIIVLNEGSVIEMGFHNQLINKKGNYYRLYNTQFVNEKEVKEEGIKYV
jgi:ABC-type multidrug transport system fused ATPase/permease subunit